MKKTVVAFSFAMAMTAVSMPSHAGAMYKQNFLCKHFSYMCQEAKPVTISSESVAAAPVAPTVRAVPEIDAANAALALALLGGIVSISRERRRKRQA